MTNQGSNSKTSKDRVKQCESAQWQNFEALKTERQERLTQRVIQVGKSTGLLHFFGVSSVNIGCHSRCCSFYKFYSFKFTHKISNWVGFVNGKHPNFSVTDLKEKRTVLKINPDIRGPAKLKGSLAGNAQPRRPQKSERQEKSFCSKFHTCRGYYTLYYITSDSIL